MPAKKKAAPRKATRRTARAPQELVAADVVPEVTGDEAPPGDELRLGPRLKLLRESRGWSIQRLAREAGTSSATIFKIEKEQMVPSITVLLKLSRALDYPVAEILDEKQAPRERRDYAVLRKKDRPSFRFTEFPVTIDRLVGPIGDRQLEAGIYLVDEGGTSMRDALTHAGEKIYFVVSGRVKLELDGQVCVLGTGDAVHLKGSVPHRWENAADGPSQLMFVMTPPLSR